MVPIFTGPAFEFVHYYFLAFPENVQTTTNIVDFIEIFLFEFLQLIRIRNFSDSCDSPNIFIFPVTLSIQKQSLHLNE